MAKDYVKKSPAKRPWIFRQLALLSTSFLCGYLTATVFDLTSLTTWVDTHIFKTTPVTEVHTAIKSPSVKPKFEFYTLLAKDNHAKFQKPTPPPAPDVSTSNPVAQSKALTQQLHASIAAASSKSKEAFLIQIAAFNKSQDAEQLKASLVLGGFDATISPILKGSVYWYRVSVGPFSSRMEAEAAQGAIAKKERIKGLIRKVDV